MYTIRQAAARSGLNIPVIRAWERRYGVVRPARTSAGYRLYDDEAIARLLAMRHLVGVEGWRPSQAAERVLAPGADLAALGRGSTGSAPGATPDATTSGRPSDAAVASFVAAAHRLDVPAMERILDESFAAQRFELAVDEVVSPALRAIGDAWSAGNIDVADEHAASETVRRRLARFFDATGRGDRVPQVIVGLPPTGHHDIGALAFAVAARRAGLDVLYLGADVPLESWLTTVRETAAPVAVLGVVTQSDVAAAAGVVDALRASTRPPTCVLGGPQARYVPAAAGVVRLPETIDDGVASLVGLMAAVARQSA